MSQPIQTAHLKLNTFLQNPLQPRWDDKIADQINYCNMLIVLVDSNTFTNTGVIKEIASADSQNIPIFGVYVNGAGSGTVLPKGLQSIRTLNWSGVLFPL